MTGITGPHYRSEPSQGLTRLQTRLQTPAPGVLVLLHAFMRALLSFLFTDLPCLLFSLCLSLSVTHMAVLTLDS